MSLVLCDTQKINKILSIPKIPLCSKCLGKKNTRWVFPKIGDPKMDGL